MTSSAFTHLQRAQLTREQHQENAARTALQYYEYETTGTGDLIPTQPLMFQTPFFVQPYVGYGVIMDRLPDREHYRLPQATGGVMRWEQNERGFYLGAYVYFRIDCQVIEENVVADMRPALPTLVHNFTFVGPSYKQMGAQVRAEALDEAATPIRSYFGVR